MKAEQERTPLIRALDIVLTGKCIKSEITSVRVTSNVGDTTRHGGRQFFAQRRRGRRRQLDTAARRPVSASRSLRP